MNLDMALLLFDYGFRAESDLAAGTVVGNRYSVKDTGKPDFYGNLNILFGRICNSSKCLLQYVCGRISSLPAAQIS